MRLLGQKLKKFRSKKTRKLHWVLLGTKKKTQCIIFPEKVKKINIREYGVKKRVIPAHILKRKTLEKLFEEVDRPE